MAARTHLGNEPVDASMMASNGNWSLYERKSIGKWRNFKLISLVPLPTKANYWIAFDTESKTLVKGREEKVLKRNHPEAYRWMLSIITGAE